MFRGWVAGRNALVAGWEAGELTGWRLGGIVTGRGSGGPSRTLFLLCARAHKTRMRHKRLLMLAEGPADGDLPLCYIVIH